MSKKWTEITERRTQQLAEWLRDGLARGNLRKGALAEALQLDASAVSKMIGGTRAFQEHEVAIISRFLGSEPPAVDGAPEPIERLTNSTKLQRIAKIAELGLAGSPEFRKAALLEILGLARGEQRP